MADITLVKISALPAAEQIGAEDLLPVVQEGATKAVAYGVIKDDIAEELAPDATLSEAGKAADAKAVGDALALKADKTELTAEVSRIDAALNTKVNNTTFNEAVSEIDEVLGTKADAAATAAALATKANTNDVTEALALKADAATVNAGLSLKADKTELTAGLATKQNVLTFDSTPTHGSTNPVTSGGVWEADERNEDDIDKAFDDLFDIFGSLQPSDFELGNIRMSDTGWTYSPSDQRVRTREGVTYHLVPGTIVGLSDYTDAQYYIGWKKQDGTYCLNGWLHMDVPITEEGDYVFLIVNNTARTQTSKDALYNLLRVDNVNSLQNQIADTKVKALFNFVSAEYSTEDGVMSNTGAIQTSSPYQKRLVADVVEGETIEVSGINYMSASFPLYILMNGDTIVSYYRETVAANSYLTRTFVVPAGINKVVVNELINFGTGSIKKAHNNIDVIEDIQSKVIGINQYYTDTNNVLWIGTSIPDGATYPQKACEANGYVCINRSLGSSKLCFENTYISGSDVNKGKRLTATVAELEALYREDVTNGIITEATLNMWKNYSYENSILPYINGTNPAQVSMIVIDHGFNDRGTIYTQMQDANNIDWDSTDRTTFTGAFKYLLNKIQEINPFIKIVISGYFTNTVKRLAFSYYSPQICGMQELIGEHYDIYVMKAWEHTQINSVHVAGTSNYLAEFNAQYGTSYEKITPDAEGNITALQLYCPDGIHPHTDKTGRCNKRLNAVYTKLLAHTI